MWEIRVIQTFEVKETKPTNSAQLKSNDYGFMELVNSVYNTLITKKKDEKG